jgi:hypothetical protein
MLRFGSWPRAPSAGAALRPLAVCTALGLPILAVGVVALVSTALTYAVIAAVYRRSSRRIAQELDALAGGEGDVASP